MQKRKKRSPHGNDDYPAELNPPPVPFHHHHSGHHASAVSEASAKPPLPPRPNAPGHRGAPARPTALPHRRRPRVEELILNLKLAGDALTDITTAALAVLAGTCIGHIPYIVGVLLPTMIAITAHAAHHHRKEARQRTTRVQRLSYTLNDLDRMTPLQFELAFRNLLLRDGIKARHVGGRNDQVADVIARDSEHVYVIQAKHTTCARDVGVNVLYALNGTAWPVHGANIAIVATNGGFTTPARRWAVDYGIYLLDRLELELWAELGHSLYEILNLPQPLATEDPRRYVERRTRTRTDPARRRDPDLG
jgi:restriction system protein